MRNCSRAVTQGDPSRALAAVSAEGFAQHGGPSHGGVCEE